MMTECPRVAPSFYLNIGSSVVSAVKIFESPDSKGQPPSIISGDVGGNIKSWNSHTQRAEQTLTDHADNDQSAAVLWLDTFSDEDGSSYLVVQRRFSIFVSTFKYNRSSPPHSRWVLATHLTLSLVETHNAFCSGDVMYPYLVAPQGEKTMVLAQFDNNSCNKAASLATEPTKGNLTALRLGSNHSNVLLFAGFEGGNIDLLQFNSPSLEVLHTVKLDQAIEAPSILSIDYDCLRQRGIASTSEDFIISLDLEGNVCKKRELPSKGVSQIRIRKSDSKLAVGACWDSTLRIFSWLKPEKLKPLGALRFHQEGLTCVDCSSSAGWLACGSKDGKLSVWKGLYT